MRALVDRFEKLAVEMERVLDLTSRIVNCVEEDCIQLALPMARSLHGLAEQVMSERVGAALEIADVFRHESAMLGRLADLMRSEGSIAREVRSLGILVDIEVARLGNEGSRFQNLAHELRDFASFISAEAEEADQKTRQRRLTLGERRSMAADSTERMKRHSLNIGEAINDALVAVDNSVSELRQAPSQFTECVSEVAEGVSQVVASVQLRDATRQQIEHVRDALAGLDDGADSNRSASQKEHGAAILRIQKLQLESARESAQGWLEQIESCLDALLHIGSAKVTEIEAKILAQNQLLEAEIRQVEEFEREANADDAVIDSGLAGLGEFMQIVRAHLNRCETAQQRMLLLNLNSIVEAHHLGDRAAAVLEIATQLSRVAGQWSEMTRQSQQVIEEALAGAAQAEQRTRTLARSTSESIEQAQKQGKETLVRLRRSAEAAKDSSSQVHEIVSGLQSRAAQVREWTSGLSSSLQVLSEVLERIEQAQGEIGEYDQQSLTELDLERLESDFSAKYTAELERRVLRAALYGDAMPVAAAAPVGNDVELF